MVLSEFENIREILGMEWSFSRLSKVSWLGSFVRKKRRLKERTICLLGFPEDFKKEGFYQIFLKK